MIKHIYMVLNMHIYKYMNFSFKNNIKVNLGFNISTHSLTCSMILIQNKRNQATGVK